MKCAKCLTALGHINARGEPMLRTRGLILKAEGVSAVCPSCKADVPVTGEMAKALASRLLVIPTARGGPK
jgi:hypothetical protein